MPSVETAIDFLATFTISFRDLTYVRVVQHGPQTTGAVAAGIEWFLGNNTKTQKQVAWKTKC